MGKQRFVALLRGINVGGKNLVKMADLRATFAALGHVDVASFIASGNVLFTSTIASKPRLTRALEAAVEEAFGCGTPIVLVSAGDLARVLAEAPRGFGTQPDLYRHDVLFVKEPLTAAAVLPDVPARDGVDTVTAGTHAIYFRRLVARAAQSQLAKLGSRPVYRHLTIRNWNTTSKLAALAAS